jgi:predicted SnoaL-like aldol condensation-catalyzing enzyme
MTTTEAQNKAFVLEAFDTLFNKRDYAATERFWSPAYIQHSANIAPGREGALRTCQGLAVSFLGSFRTPAPANAVRSLGPIAEGRPDTR